MKSWKTTLMGLICFVCCFWSIDDNLQREAYHFRYWQIPIALFAIGVMGICARDHSHKDKL